MPRMNEKEFLSALKGGLNSSLYLLYGDDEYSKNICFKRLLKSHPFGDDAVFIDGQALDIKKLQEECQSVSFFSSDKCVYVRNPMIESYSSPLLESLYTVISEKSESTYLIFICKNQEVNAKKSAKWAKFIKTIEANGTVIECAQKTQKDVVSMIIKTAKKSGCEIETSVAENLAQRDLNDMLMIENDLVKLCAFAAEKSNGVITIDAIEHLSAVQLDYKAYEITKQLIKRNYSDALHILDSLFLQQVDAVAINAALSSSFMDIYRVKLMQQHNKLVSILCAPFGYRENEFRLKGASYDAQKCSLDFLKKAIMCLFDADIKLKSTKDNKRIVLEKALVNIILGDKADYCV